MASNAPVPSRVALNALRGVILTTSCSVVLLAEERRRRLQIARAAIDNARKLHMVQSNRGPIALSESHGPWDGRFAEIDDDVLSTASLPRPRTSTRRRGRTHLIGTDHPRQESREHDGGRTQSTGRAESQNAPTKPSRATNFLGNGLDMVIFDALKLNSSRSNIEQALEWKAPKKVGRPLLPIPTVNSAVPSTMATENKVHVAPADINEYETMTDEELGKRLGSLEAAHLYLKKTEHGSLAPRPYYDDVVPVLERLLRDLETPNIGKDLHTESFSLAKRIFDRVASFGPPLPKAANPLRSQAIRFFRITSHSYPEDITATLSGVLPLSKDPLKLLIPFITILQNSNQRNSLRVALLFLSRNSTSCQWARGMLVCHLLVRHARVYNNFFQTKQLYMTLQESGLFRDIEVSQESEYKIRRLMIIQALEAGEDGFANAELRNLEKVGSGASMSDIRLQKHIIARKASSGKWNDVLSEIGVLRERTNPRCVEYQSMLTKTTDIVAQTRDNEELEAFLRKAVTDFDLKLKHRWIYAVLDGYASRRQAEPVFSWLQFCVNNGLRMDISFSQRFLARCRKYWSFSDKTIRRLEKRLLVAGRLKWDQPADSNNDAGPNLCKSPADTLRQAVLEQLNCESPDVARARLLIRSAHDEGCDVSEALTPLLMAQLARGDDPSRLINEALQMGVRLHDSTYNKAAQALSAEGNHRAAADMCETAARENGKGQLLYNEYNFANLVFAYTGSASYRALQSVLSGFTSDMQWWHGSRTCKESIKLAMKATAMRTVAHSEDSEPHRQALDQLDDALLHVKKCRSTKEERRAVSEAYVHLARAPSWKASHKIHGRSTRNKVGDVVRDSCMSNSQTQVDHSILAAASGAA